jgi:hypothetical protein
LGQDRKCRSCSIPLSAYNDDDTCAKCLVNPTDVKKVLKDLKGLANGKFE